MRISYSGLRTYDMCPLRYKFEAVDKIKVPPTKDQDFGGSVHDVLKYLHTGPPEQQPKLEEALTRFERRLTPYFYKDSEELGNYIARGRRILTEYYNQELPLVGHQVANLERSFTVALDEAGEHKVSGRIDRVDYYPASDLYEVIDYKTGWRLPTVNAAADSVQLAIYDRAVREMYNAERVVVSLYHVEHLKKQEVERQAESWERTRGEILGTIANIEAEKFDPKPGPYCVSCPHQRCCPMWMHKFKDEIQLDDSLGPQELTAEELTEQYLLLHADFKRLEAALEALKPQIHSAMNQLGVEQLFFKPIGSVRRLKTEKAEFDKTALAEILRDCEALAEAISFSNTTLSRFAKAGYLTANQIARIESVKSSKPVFSLRVQAATDDLNDDEAE